MEQLIVIAVFAICASACVWILTVSFFTARDTRDMRYALISAQSAAETYKAAAGDIDMAAGILGGMAEDGGETEILSVYYDASWHVGGREAAAYILRITPAPRPHDDAFLLRGELSVETSDGKEILTFPVAVNRAVASQTADFEW